MAKKKQDNKSNTSRIANKKARYDYHILEVVECGMALTGTEIKSLRNGNARLDEAYAAIKSGQVYLIGATIAHYPQAAEGMQHNTTRDRKLLLHHRQIDQLAVHTKQKGKTLIPLAIYFKRGWAKCEIGVAIGKRMYDKRDAMKKRDQQREISRELDRRGR